MQWGYGHAFAVDHTKITSPRAEGFPVSNSNAADVSHLLDVYTLSGDDELLLAPSIIRRHFYCMFSILIVRGQEKIIKTLPSRCK